MKNFQAQNNLVNKEEKQIAWVLVALFQDSPLKVYLVYVNALLPFFICKWLYICQVFILPCFSYVICYTKLHTASATKKKRRKIRPIMW